MHKAARWPCGVRVEMLVVIEYSVLIVRYGDSAGNTTEENSSVFSLIRMRYFSLQCFDTVGWVSGRASGL